MKDDEWKCICKYGADDSALSVSIHFMYTSPLPQTGVFLMASLDVR
jgi:hypothetical protein